MRTLALLATLLLTACVNSNDYNTENLVVTECIPDVDTSVINKNQIQGDAIRLSYDYNRTISILFDHHSIVGTEYLYKQSFNIVLPKDGIKYDRTLCLLDTHLMNRLTEYRMIKAANKMVKGERLTCNDFFAIK